MSLLIRSILEGRDFAKPLTSLLTEHDMSKQLATMLFVSSQVKHQSLQENINDVYTKYPKIYSIVTENCLMLPEEEAEVARTIKCMHEEMITTVAIDTSTPRIARKNKDNDVSIFKR